MSHENHQHEGKEIIRPVPSRESSFMVFRNSNHQASAPNYITPLFPKDPFLSIATNNNDGAESSSRSSQPDSFPTNKNRDSSSRSNFRPLKDCSNRVIAQSCNSGFSTPSNLSSLSTSLECNQNRGSFLDPNETATQSMSSQSDQYTIYSIANNSDCHQDLDDDHLSLGSMFRRHGNQLSNQSNTVGAIRVSPFEPIVCDRNWPRQGRISPLPTPEYEAWQAQRRVNGHHAATASYLPVYQPPLQEEYHDHQIFDQDELDEDTKDTSATQFRPVSATPSDHDTLGINEHY